ncbi:LemA family protein [Thermaurantiacus sp.]
MPRLTRIALPPVLALLLASCGINTVPTKDEAVKAAWGEVQNQYQRRADLVPNLVATVEGFAKQEKDVLVEVTNARARATAVNLTPDQLSDPAALQRFGEAQGALSQSLGRLLLVVERYPELKSNQNFLALQSQLEGTENRIAIARRDYNAAVQDYNTTIRTFPAIVAAKLIYGAEARAPFEATTPGADRAPEVKFGAS